MCAGDGLFPKELDIVGFAIAEFEEPFATVFGFSTVLGREGGTSLELGTENDSRRIVVVGSGVGNVSEPGDLGLFEASGYFGPLFGEIMGLPWIHLHVVKFQRHVFRHFVVAESGWVNELPALLANSDVM